MTEFKFSGKVELGFEKQPFTREVKAETEEYAEDMLYSKLTSEHSINRSKVNIKETEEVE